MWRTTFIYNPLPLVCKDTNQRKHAAEPSSYHCLLRCRLSQWIIVRKAASYSKIDIFLDFLSRLWLNTWEQHIPLVFITPPLPLTDSQWSVVSVWGSGMCFLCRNSYRSFTDNRCLAITHLAVETIRWTVLGVGGGGFKTAKQQE